MFSARHFVAGIVATALLGGVMSVISGLSFWWLWLMAVLAMLANGWIADRLDGD